MNFIVDTHALAFPDSYSTVFKRSVKLYLALVHKLLIERLKT